MDTGSLNYLWCLSLLDSYVSGGVRHAVISPGSRSTPLTLACERHPQITTWVQVDERSAAFFALGLTTKSRQPVILVCTSGSAVANWLPAVVEANHARVPLILLSADRPAELQDCGANQTINQQHLFGSQVRSFYALPEAAEDLLRSAYLSQRVARSLSEAQQAVAGPVHLNIPLREPLLPQADDLNQAVDDLTRQVLGKGKAVQIVSGRLAIDAADVSVLSDTLTAGAGIIIVGRKHYPSAFAELLNQLAERLQVPVLVDHLSNLRFGRHAKTQFIANYDFFLRQHTPVNAPAWVLRFGALPVSKVLAGYLDSCSEALSIVVDEATRWQDPLLTADYVVQSDDESLCRQLLQQVTETASDTAFQTEFRQLEQQSAALIKEAIKPQAELSEGHVIRAVFARIAEQGFVFSSNSMTVRQLDTFTFIDETSGRPLSIYCNRGASGIDGNLSTYLGLLAANPQHYGVALLGDLAFLHDINALAMCAELNARGCSGTIIVINNQGGHIFNFLPQRELKEFRQYWLTPQAMNLQHAAKLFGLEHRFVEGVANLDQLLDESLASPGIDLIEVLIDQQNSLASHENLLKQQIS